MDAAPTDRIISADALKAALDKGPAPQLIDVRQPWEYEEFHIPGAKLIPLPELPSRLGEIDPAAPAVTYCASGRRSLAAAELLAGQGLGAVRSLAGGIMGWRGAAAAGPEDQGLALFPAHAEPMAILGLAYLMEDNLGGFYAGLAVRAADPELQELFERLHSFEEAHKAMVLRLARALDPAATGEALAAKAPATAALEGGVQVHELMAQRGQDLSAPATALDVAMMFEAQALDLYARLGRRLDDPAARRQAMALMDEETRHLRALGRMMDAQAGKGAKAQ